MREERLSGEEDVDGRNEPSHPRCLASTQLMRSRRPKRAASPEARDRRYIADKVQRDALGHEDHGVRPVVCLELGKADGRVAVGEQAADQARRVTYDPMPFSVPAHEIVRGADGTRYWGRSTHGEILPMAEFFASAKQAAVPTDGAWQKVTMPE
jgi:hypothetical protein